MRNMIKKVIVPALVIVVLFAVLRPLCIQDGKCNYLLLLLLMGLLWILPGLQCPYSRCQFPECGSCPSDRWQYGQ